MGSEIRKNQGITKTSHQTIRLNEIPNGGQDYEYNSLSGELNGWLEDILGPTPHYQAHLFVTQQEDMARIQGEVAGELPYECSRCAETYKLPFKKSFITAFYTNEGQLESLASKVDDLEGSFDLEFLDKPEIDLGEVLHEQIAIEIPFQPLCSEGCQGLCTQCGANLNTEKCTCQVNEGLQSVSPFDKLKSISIN